MNLSDDDLAAIIAYVKTLPPIDNELPSGSMGPLGRALLVAGKLPILHAERIDHARPHLARCSRCAHGRLRRVPGGLRMQGLSRAGLAGGKIIDGAPDWPPAANLTPAGPTKS